MGWFSSLYFTCHPPANRFHPITRHLSYYAYTARLLKRPLVQSNAGNLRSTQWRRDMKVGWVATMVEGESNHVF